MELKKYGKFTARGFEWTDSTSYSRNAPEQIPTMFNAQIGELKITITNGHVHYRGEFIFHCFNIGLESVRLPGATNHTEAAEMAFDACRAKVEAMYKAFQV